MFGAVGGGCCDAPIIVRAHFGYFALFSALRRVSKTHLHWMVFEAKGSNCSVIVLSIDIVASHSIRFQGDCLVREL